VLAWDTKSSRKAGLKAQNREIRREFEEEAFQTRKNLKSQDR